MAHQECPAGVVLRLRPDEADWSVSDRTSVLRLDGLELIRISLPQGKKMPKHQAPGHMILQCLEGKIRFEAEERAFDIPAGHFVHLPAHVPHSLEALENSMLMLTVAEIDGPATMDSVNEASQESFPASDPPSQTGVTRA